MRRMRTAAGYSRTAQSVMAVLVTAALIIAALLSAGATRHMVLRLRSPHAAATTPAPSHEPTPLWPVDGRPVVIAHRGGEDAAENSLAAIASAAREGADYAELDVRLTADGHVVVFHDRYTGRLSAEGRNLRVADLTLAQLRRMPMTSHGMVYYVPTLTQAIRAAKRTRRTERWRREHRRAMIAGHGSDGHGAAGHGAAPSAPAGLGLLLDMKTGPHHAARLIGRVTGILQREGFTDHALMMSTSPDVVRMMRRLRPGWRIGFCCRDAAGLRRVEYGHTRLDFLVVTCALAGNAVFARGRRLCRLEEIPLYAGLGAKGAAGGPAQYLNEGADGVLGNNIRGIERVAAAMATHGGEAAG